MTLGIQAKGFNLGFIRPENLVSHGLRVLRCLSVNSKQAVMCLLLRSSFRLVILPSRPDWWSAAEMVVLLEGNPISTEEPWSSVRVTIRGPSPSSAQFDWMDSSRKSLGGSKLLPFLLMEATVGMFNAAEIFGHPSPDLCLDTIYGQFLRPHGLVFAMTCTVNCGTL